MFPFFKNLGDLMRPATIPLEAKKSATGAILAMYHHGQPIWTPRDYASLAREGYAKNPIAYRCVRMISEAAASVPWLMYDEGQELETHPVLQLLSGPNPMQGGAEFMEDWYGYLQISGNAYLEAVSVAGEIKELYALRPDRMKIVPGSNGWPESYEYTVGDRTVRFGNEADDATSAILHMALFHPTNDYYGMSPLEVAAISIDIHNAAGSWNKALLDNSARPSGALVYKGSGGTNNLTEEQFERLKNELENTYQGAANAGRPLLLEGGLDWKSMGLSPKDMDFIEAKHVAAREIALAFGVPPMLLGIPGDNTFANYQEANKTFWRQTVIPLVAKTAMSMTRWLRSYFGPEIKLWYDIDQIDALHVEREAKWKRIGTAEFLTINEKRASFGYSPIEGGDDRSFISAP